MNISIWLSNYGISQMPSFKENLKEALHMVSDLRISDISGETFIKGRFIMHKPWLSIATFSVNSSSGYPTKRELHIRNLAKMNCIENIAAVGWFEDFLGYDQIFTKSRPVRFTQTLWGVWYTPSFPLPPPPPRSEIQFMNHVMYRPIYRLEVPHFNLCVSMECVSHEQKSIHPWTCQNIYPLI